MGGKQQNGLVIAQDALQLFHFLEKSVELRVLLMGPIADEHGLGVGLSF